MLEVVDAGLLVVNTTEARSGANLSTSPFSKGTR